MSDQCTGLLSPFLRSQRIRAAQPFLGAGRVLDYGCGGGSLAHCVDPSHYLGVDLDAGAIGYARAQHPEHTFLTMPEFDVQDRMNPFDAIAAMAVIEHLPNPQDWLIRMQRYLKPDGRIVLTTPHPGFCRVYEYGASLGVFSRDGAEEHKRLLDLHAVRGLAEAVGLRIAIYRRFLLGANQLVVLRSDRLRIHASVIGRRSVGPSVWGTQRRQATKSRRLRSITR